MRLSGHPKRNLGDFAHETWYPCLRKLVERPWWLVGVSRTQPTSPENIDSFRLDLGRGRLTAFTPDGQPVSSVGVALDPAASRGKCVVVQGRGLCTYFGVELRIRGGSSGLEDRVSLNLFASTSMCGVEKWATFGLRIPPEDNPHCQDKRRAKAMAQWGTAKCKRSWSKRS